MAAMAEYRHELAGEMAAYGLPYKIAFFYDRGPSSGTRGETKSGREEPLIGGYTLELYGPLRRQMRRDGPFKYLKITQRGLFSVVEIWEARVSLPGKPHAYWRKVWRPDGDQPATPVNFEQAGLTAKEADHLGAGFKMFVDLPLTSGGRTKGSGRFTSADEARDEIVQIIRALRRDEIKVTEAAVARRLFPHSKPESQARQFHRLKTTLGLTWRDLLRAADSA